MITRIILIISLFINVVLYYGLLDVGQYRNYVKNTVELSKKFAESKEFQDMKDQTKELGKQIIENSNTIEK